MGNRDNIVKDRVNGIVNNRSSAGTKRGDFHSHHTNINANNPSSVHTDIMNTHPTEKIALSIPPPGLSGPSSFCFSPATPIGSCHDDEAPILEGKSRYLSFVSSHHYGPHNSPTSVNRSGILLASPNQCTYQNQHDVNAPPSNGDVGERRICTIDLEPFWKYIHEMDLKNRSCPEENDDVIIDHSHQTDIGKFEASILKPAQNRKDEIDHYQNISPQNFYKSCKTFDFVSNDTKRDDTTALYEEAEFTIPITNPDILSKYCITPLLKTSISINRNNGISLFTQNKRKQQSYNNIKGEAINTETLQESLQKQNFNITNRENERDRALSLEEQLRMERQRVDTTGVTQFDWKNVMYKFKSKNDFLSKKVKHMKGPSSPNCKHNLEDSVHLTTNEDISLSKINSEISSSSSSSCKPPLYNHEQFIRIIVPMQGKIYLQDGVGNDISSPLRLLYHMNMLNDVDKINKEQNGSNGGINIRKTGSAIGRDAGAIDPQLSPDGTMVAFVVAGDIYVMNCDPVIHEKSVEPGYMNNLDPSVNQVNEDLNHCEGEKHNYVCFRKKCNRLGTSRPIQVTFGAVTDETKCKINENGSDETATHKESCDDNDNLNWSYHMHDTTSMLLKKPFQRNINHTQYGKSITHGLADFVAQEEMDRYCGFWWDPQSEGILFARVDESCVPPYRIMHQANDTSDGSESSYEDHRYPFAGKCNPDVSLGYVSINKDYILGHTSCQGCCKERIHKFENGENKTSDEADICTIRKGSSQRILFMNEGAKQCVSEIDEVAREDAKQNWLNVNWFKPPTEECEYLARVNWLPDGSACVQWQNRQQTTLLLVKLNVKNGEYVVLHTETSKKWVNLHHMLWILPKPLPFATFQTSVQEEEVVNNSSFEPGSFSYLFASERTGFCHLYLYTYIAGNTSATLIRAVSAGEWIVESIVGVDVENNAVYVTGTFDSPLERHLYALPLLLNDMKCLDNLNAASAYHLRNTSVKRGFKHVMNSLKVKNVLTKSRKNNVPNFDYVTSHDQPLSDQVPIAPIRLTDDPGMHNIIMDDTCRLVVDTNSDLTCPTAIKVYFLPGDKPFLKSNVQNVMPMKLLLIPYNAAFDGYNLNGGFSFNDWNSSNLNTSKLSSSFPPPELLTFRTSDDSETLHAALFCPNPNQHGPGPYPLICAVYGGPTVQRVNRSWAQSIDMRAQRLRSLGFAVVKCDNRGSSRRGLAFESVIKHRLGLIEVLDQVTCVKHLIAKGIADKKRVGVYGWSYGGYLAAMCLSRAPDVFHLAVAGAPVTSWDGYDTHYTERYMGQPSENIHGYDESAIFEHVANIRGKLMIVHGLIDENVHFRHTARLVNRLIACGKEYDLLVFPDERHSPRKLKDRVYMEKRISSFFIQGFQYANYQESSRLKGKIELRAKAGYL